MRDILRFLGLAKRAGKLVCGDAAVTEAFAETKLVCVADDLSESSRKRANKAAVKAECKVVTLAYTKEDIGRALGRKPCGILAITDYGFAKAVIEAVGECEDNK